jgi:CDP-diglyceride synthetase
MSTLLALIIAAAGWYYLFYSQAAHRLGTLEATTANIKRVRLRRLNGAAMILLAVLLYVGTRAIDPQQSPRAFVYAWLGVIALLLLIVTLVLVDLRLTHDLRRRARK